MLILNKEQTVFENSAEPGKARAMVLTECLVRASPELLNSTLELSSTGKRVRRAHLATSLRRLVTFTKGFFVCPTCYPGPFLTAEIGCDL